MLLECEVFEQRDDWDSFKAIMDPFQFALDALAEPAVDEEGERAKVKVAKDRLMLALRVVQRTPELTQNERRRVIDELKDRFAAARNELVVKGLTGHAQISLSEIMRRSTISVAEAARRGPVSDLDIEAPE